MPLSTELDLDRPFSDYRHETVLNIIHTANLLAAVGTHLFRQFDLTEAQFNVLFALKYKTREITQAELGRRLVVSRASITSVLDKLESKGLVRRKSVPNNRRIHHVALTAKGKRLIEKVEPLYREKLHEAVAGLTEEACRVMISHLEHIRGVTDKLREQKS